MSKILQQIDIRYFDADRLIAFQSTTPTHLFLALHLVQRLKYALHWMYIKTMPPVSPTVTTTSFVQKGQLIRPFFTSSVARSISTHSDQITHVAAAQ